MYKLDYVLIAKGYKTHIHLFNGQVIKLDKPMNAIYYGARGYVIGQDEESCMQQVRLKLKKKYEGFGVIKFGSLTQ
jgi:hypothetical protein